VGGCQTIHSKGLYGISINFSDLHDYYLRAYRYVNESDESVAHSKDHLNLSDAKTPSTKNLFRLTSASPLKIQALTQLAAAGNYAEKGSTFPIKR